MPSVQNAPLSRPCVRIMRWRTGWSPQRVVGVVDLRHNQWCFPSATRRVKKYFSVDCPLFLMRRECGELSSCCIKPAPARRSINFVSCGPLGDILWRTLWVNHMIVSTTSSYAWRRLSLDVVLTLWLRPMRCSPRIYLKQRRMNLVYEVCGKDRHYCTDQKGDRS